MVFSSPVFVFFFLPSVFIATRLFSGTKIQNYILSLFSILFYAFGQIAYVPLFLLSIGINYLSARFLGEGDRRRRFVLTLCVIMNLGILAVFKYTGFIVSSLNSTIALTLPVPDITLPIGISFFTFQGMSYVIDTYRGEVNDTKDFMKVLLYISFFPQLIAGPIVKYHDIESQIDNRQLTPEKTDAGICRFILGLSKKILIADAAGYIADAVFNAGGYSGADIRLLWLGAICYTLQIYYDFSGYSDMAIGLGRMFGFDIRENFLHPYASGSIKEFWRRWHISLSSWFREYLYIPLGGNRRGKLRTQLNKLVVFFCTGLWHGANWTFILWGLGHGALLTLEDFGIIPVAKLAKSPLGRFINRVYVFLSVTLLFVIFRADNTGAAFGYIAAMFSAGIVPGATALLAKYLTPAAILALSVGLLFSTDLSEKLYSRLCVSRYFAFAKHITCLLLLLISVLSMAKGGFHPFIYFQF